MGSGRNRLVEHSLLRTTPEASLGERAAQLNSPK
jgi:hypothetical protein